MTAPSDLATLDTDTDLEDTCAACRLRLTGWEGPLVQLLAQARAQQVDLTQVSAAALVDQLETHLRTAIADRSVALSQLAGWLVIAATLLALRARLLVPATPVAEEAAATRRQSLQERAAMQRAATWLEQRQQLGREVFARGAPEALADTPPATDLTELLRACLALLETPVRGVQVYRPSLPPLCRMPEALAHLRRLLPGLARDGAPLTQLIPSRGEALATPLQHRAALASTLLAGLELSRDGALILQQHDAFGPIQVEPLERDTAAMLTRTDRVP